MSLTVYTQNDIRLTVRAVLDADTTDLPDNIIDLFTRGAFEEIDGRYSRWPHRETTYSYTTVGGTAKVAFSAIGDGTLDDIRSMTNLTQNGFLMPEVSQEDAEAYYTGANLTQAVPAFYSVTGDNTINFWPIPSGAYSLLIRGYRTSSNWFAIGAGGIPDLPTAFHTSLVYKVISMIYAQGEDDQLAALWDQYYTKAAAVAEQKTFRPTENRPYILHGRRSRPGFIGEYGLVQSLQRY